MKKKVEVKSGFRKAMENPGYTSRGHSCRFLTADLCRDLAVETGA